uniref:Uncharacterized protein n=1 Tax=Strongyloides stercoralis TaxID=6248 RepID=A0AAF5DRU3_STRER
KFLREYFIFKIIQFANFKTVNLILVVLFIGYNTHQLTIEQRARIVKLYREKGDQISLTQKAFKKEFNFTKLLKRNYFENRNLSIIKRAQDLCLNSETLRRIMKEDSKLKPYKIQLVYKITAVKKKFANDFKQLYPLDAELCRVKSLVYTFLKMIKNVAWAYKDKSKIVEKLKNNIEREIDHIGSITLKKVMQGDYERIQNCSQLQGRHLEDDFYHPEKNIL